MWITDILNSHRLNSFSKIKLISYHTKRLLLKNTPLKINITEEELFVRDCYKTLFRFDGVLLKNSKDEYLVRYKLPVLGWINLYIRKNPASDHEVFHQIFEASEYKALVDHVLSFRQSDQIKYIMDAGANVGYTTLYLQKFFPNANFICIEPEEGNFSQLKKNISINNLQNINLLKAGVWNRDEDLEISSNFRDKKEWSFQVVESKKAQLPGYTVQTIMKMYGWTHIDILKIDIEGAERYVFGNIEAVEKFLPFVKFIILEIHDEYDIRDSIYSILSKFNFKYFNSGESTIGVNTTFINIEDSVIK